MEKIKLLITTPTKEVLQKEVDFVTLPSQSGELGVLYGHIDLAVLLNAGALKYTVANEEGLFAIGEGIAQITKDSVNVFCQDATSAKEIDEEKARQEINKIKKMTIDSNAELDPDMATIMIKRQLAKIKVKRTRI